MTNEINLIELFSGIGGFSKGLEDAGFKINKHYFSEIDKHAVANYKYNFPNAKYIGSVTDISGRDFRGINAITFGSPCQDFSIAGKGEGMDGQRSVLILEAIRLITELRPPVFIWENVKGAFSSNSGADFWGILQAFANIGGYRLEWQLLNTKWFLPQNRERIYLVGHLAGSERSFGNVFPFGQNDQLPVCTEKSDGRRKQAKYNSTTLRAGNMKATDTFIISQRSRGNNKGADFNECPTISANSFEHNNHVNNIRRLTEIECERLQGFPDDWTRYEVYEKQVWINKKEGTFNMVEGVNEVPKTERYRMCGNAVTTDAVKEIGKRLLQ